MTKNMIHDVVDERTFSAVGIILGNTNGTGSGARFRFPSGLAVDRNGNLLVADTDNQVIRQVTAAGVVTTVGGSGVIGSTDAAGTAAQFFNPKGIAVDRDGNIFVADRGNHTIRRGAVSPQ